MLGFFTHVCVLFAGLLLTAANSDEPVYRAVGDEVVLTPGPVSDPTIITWRHGQEVAMEWFKGSVESFRQFKERGDINSTTGALTITGLTPGDSGNYTAEINHKETRTTQLLVISRVFKPTVSIQCDPDNTYCIFTCESDTTNAEPATYAWISQEKSWDSTKEITITKEELENQFYCELSNPVSTEDSEMVQNPFSTWKWYEILLIVCAVLIVAAVIGFYWKIKGGRWYQILLIVCAVLIVPAGIGFYFIYWEKRGGKLYQILLIVCSALIVPAGFGFNFIYREKIRGKWYLKGLIVWASLIVPAGIGLDIIYSEKGRGCRPTSEIFDHEGKWFQIVCVVLIVPAVIVFYIIYWKIKREKWYQIGLIVCSALIVAAVIGFYFIYWKIKGGWRPTSEIFEYEGRWYQIGLIVGSALIVPAGFGFYFIYWEIKGVLRPTSESTSGRLIPVFSCRYNKRDQGPGSDSSGGAESRPENVSVNHAPTSTVSLENSEEKEALVGSSQDQESDLSSETRRKDEVCGESNQEPTADADPESSSQTDIRASPDQVLTDATSEAEVYGEFNQEKAADADPESSSQTDTRAFI